MINSFEIERHPVCSEIDSCNSYPFCHGCGAWFGTDEDLQKQLDEFFINKPYKVTFISPEIEKSVAY